ncbi:MAG: phospholipid carrier-dependent glycosyltransferase [Coleofasciculus sp. G3-WIS-01]|uniref:phospholipid carrier-dependent glycosyltransferase n=1 Tax=Coleofasciculus sp. G3-WIS-01 TaxID=3069528 RepID=UPI00330109B8
MAVIVHLGASLALNPVVEAKFLDADEQEYYRLAGELLHGEYEFQSRRTLGFVLILALFRLVTQENLIATQLLTTTLFSLVGPLMYILVRRITGHNLLAVTVAVLVIFWPPFLFYGSTLYSETAALPLFITLLILLPRGSILTQNSDGGWLRCILAGVLMGLCIHIRPMYLLFTPLAVVILFLEEHHWHIALRRSVLLAIGCCLVVLPWSVYISVQEGVPFLISSNGGETISGGLNAVLVEQDYKVVIAPDGRETWVGPGKWLTESKSGYLNQEELKLPYAQRDKLLIQRTIAWVINNPFSALHLQTAKLLYMWGFYPFWQGAKQTLFGNLPTVILIGLSSISLIRFRCYLRHLSRLWILPVFVSVVALISWGSWRFRQPGDLGLLMFGSLFLWSMFVKPKRLMPLYMDRTSIKSFTES